MADSIDSLPFRIQITDTNEHEVQIHPNLQSRMGDYLFLDVRNGTIDIGISGQAISVGASGRYSSDNNPRCVLKNNGGSFRYKATAAGAELVGSA